MEEQSTSTKSSTDSLFCVTPLSKYLAMLLMLILPFVGAYLGYTLASEKVVDRVVVKEIKETKEFPYVDYLEEGSARLNIDTTNIFVISPVGEMMAIDKAIVSPDNSFVYFEESLATGDPHGGVARYVYDVDEKVSHPVEFIKDDEQYNDADPYSSIYDLRLIRGFTNCIGWSFVDIDMPPKSSSLYCELSSGNINTEQGMGVVVYYKSVSTSTPWILQPDVR